MRYVGADLHKKSITFCVVEVVSGGIVVRDRRRMLCREVQRLEAYLAAQGEYELVVETTIGYDWFAALAEKTAVRVRVAHAAKLRVIAESTRKTDKIDAYVLAELLAKDMLVEAWRPSPRVRQHRSLIRRRCKIQSRITSIKNTMRAVLTRYNEDRVDLFTKAGREASLLLDLLGAERWLLEDLWADLDANVARRDAIDDYLRRFALQAPLAEKEARAVLATMPGLGPVTIETVLAELGDWRRFRNASAVVSFAGLDPGVRQSDDRRRDLKLTKAGSPLLRWIMIQLAHRQKKTARWSREFERISKRAGKKKATCAIARRLLTVIYAMLRDGQAYKLPKAA